MSNETIFYIFGIALAVSAVLISILGLKVKSFPGKAFPLVILWFVILAGGATTFAVRHAKDEEKEKAAVYEQAGKEIERETSSGPYEQAASEGEGSGSEETEVEKEGGEASAGGEAGAAAKGPGGTVKLAAAENELKFNKTKLTSKPGKVTIDFDNPSSIPHNVHIENENGEVLGGTETIAQQEESTTVELAPGTYTFFCSIPGHREAGMEGTLVVK